MLSLTSPGATPEEEVSLQLRDQRLRLMNDRAAIAIADDDRAASQVGPNSTEATRSFSQTADSLTHSLTNSTDAIRRLEEGNDAFNDEDGDWDGRELIKQVEERYEKAGSGVAKCFLATALLLVIAAVAVSIARQRAPWDLNFKSYTDVFFFVFFLFDVILVLCLCPASAVQRSMARKGCDRLMHLKEELRQGTALLLWYSPEQWQSFVDYEFGPDGRLMQEQQDSLCGQCCTFLVCSVGLMVMIFLGLHLKKGVSFGTSFSATDSHILPWWLLPAFACPFGFVAAFVQPCCNKRLFRLQYKRHSENRLPIIMGSQTFVFDQLLLFKGEFGKKVLECGVRTTSTADKEGKHVRLTYEVVVGKSKVTKEVFFPMPFGREAEVLLWIKANANFYLNQPTPREQTRAQVVQGVRIVVKAGKILAPILRDLNAS